MLVIAIRGRERTGRKIARHAGGGEPVGDFCCCNLASLVVGIAASPAAAGHLVHHGQQIVGRIVGVNFGVISHGVAVAGIQQMNVGGRQGTRTIIIRSLHGSS